MSALVINLTHSSDDVDRTSVAMVVAGAAVASAQTTTVFLSSDGVSPATTGVAQTLHEEGFAPLGALVRSVRQAGGALRGSAPVARSGGCG